MTTTQQAPASPFRSLSFFGLNGGTNGGSPNANRKTRRSVSHSAIVKPSASGNRSAPLQVDRRAALMRKLEQSKTADEEIKAKKMLTPSKSEKSLPRNGDEEDNTIRGMLASAVQRRLTNTFDGALATIGGLSNGLEGAAADAAAAIGLEGKGRHRGKKPQGKGQQEQVRRVLLDRRQSLTMYMGEENVKQASKPLRRRQNPGGLWGAMASFQEHMSMLMHVEDQLTEVANSGQKLQLVIAKDGKNNKDDELSSTTSSSDDEDEAAENGEGAEDHADSEENKKSYQFSSGTRQLSQKEVEVLLAKGCLDAEEVRRLRTRLRELEDAANAPPSQAPPKPAQPEELTAKGQGKGVGKGPLPPGASAPEAVGTTPALVKGKGKPPVAPPAGPAGKGAPPPSSGAGGKGGPPAPPGKGKGKGAAGAPIFGRKWHWKSLQSHESQCTIWSELLHEGGGDGPPMTWRVDVKTMQDLFKEVVDPNAKKDAAPKEPVKTEIKVFDAKRAQNLAIGLMGLRNNCQVDLDDVARAVSKLDGGNAVIGSMEVIELLATLLPSPEEAKGLAAIPEADRENLRDVEKQLWMISGVPRLPARLRVLFFEKKQVDLDADAKDRLQLLSRASMEVRSSKAFRSFLTVCLSIGNFVNHSFVWRSDTEATGTPVLPAAGFKIESALKLRDFQAAKSAKKEVSLLHIVLFHLARFVQDTWPEDPSIEEQGTPCRKSVMDRVSMFEGKAAQDESPAATPLVGSQSEPLGARQRARGSSLRPARTPKRTKTQELDAEPCESTKAIDALKRWHKALLSEMSTLAEGIKDSLDDIQDDIGEFSAEVAFLQQERLTHAASYPEPEAVQALQRIEEKASARATALEAELETVRDECQSLCTYFGEKVPKRDKLSEKTQEFMRQLTEVVAMLSRGVSDINEKRPLQRMCMLDFKMPDGFKLPEAGAASTPGLPKGKAPLPASLPPPGKAKGKGKGPPLPGAAPSAVAETTQSIETQSKEDSAEAASGEASKNAEPPTNAPVKGKSKGKGPPLPGSFPVSFPTRVPEVPSPQNTEGAQDLPEVPPFPSSLTALPDDSGNLEVDDSSLTDLLDDPRIPEAMEEEVNYGDLVE